MLFRSRTDSQRFEKNFNHHLETFLQIVGYTASRENASLLPLHVRLTNLNIPTAARQPPLY